MISWLGLVLHVTCATLQLLFAQLENKSVLLIQLQLSHTIRRFSRHLGVRSALLGTAELVGKGGRSGAVQMASPFKPSVNHVDSVENFDKIWTDQAAEDSPCGTPPAPDAFSTAAAAFEVLLLPVVHTTCVLSYSPGDHIVARCPAADVVLLQHQGVTEENLPYVAHARRLLVCLERFCE